MIAPIGVTARRTMVAGDGDLPAAVREDVLLLVTELVNNAVRDAGAGSRRSLRIEVGHAPHGPCVWFEMGIA